MTLRPVPPNAVDALSRGEAGLTVGEAAARLAADGPNEIVTVPPSSWQDTLKDTLRDPMIWFLAGTSLLFAVLGDTAEAIVLALALVPLLGMDAWLHRRTQASTQGLAGRLSSEARVERSGAMHLVSARDLVVGDLVEVLPGEAFPADAVLVGGEGVQVDESVLTGESWPVRKSILATRPAGATLDAVHWCLAGTRVLTGTARVIVAATGSRTLYAEIVRSALAGPHEQTPLQRASGRLVSVMLAGALVLCLVLAGVRLVQGHGLLDAFLSAVTLAVAALPEEFPVVMGIFLGVGVYRLAQRKALVRRAVAVENIGRLTCICSDKTGTLTEGRLVLAHVVPMDGVSEEGLVTLARMASRAGNGDPLDEALLASGGTPDWRIVASHPFTEDRRRETNIVETGDGRLRAIVKGAPETVFALCGEGFDATRWQREAEALAAGAHKVLAVALRPVARGTAMDEPAGGYAFAGLLAFEDPVREGVRESVAHCRSGGIRVIMVTGDHPATAGAVAREIGLGGSAPVVVLADALEAADAATVARVDVVARATPGQKLRLVQLLQRAGETVAVTGDGVNDVPAIKAADIGIAMGERGTQSAREVAAIVLLDDNFRTIAEAVAEGRQLFVNLQRAYVYLLLVHLPLVLAAAAVPLLNGPILYLPVHIVILELLIHPTALLAFQQRADLKAPHPGPRDGPSHFFAWRTWAIAMGAGVMLAVVVCAAFGLAHGGDDSLAHARSLSIAMLAVMSAGIALALNGAIRGPGFLVPVVAAAAVVAVMHVPGLSTLVHLEALRPWGWIALAGAWALAAGLGVIARRSLEGGPRLRPGNLPT